MHVRFHAVCVKSPSNITVRAKTKCSWDLWHINLTNTQAKLRSVAHKSMYLETDHPRLLCKPLEEKCILGKSLEHLLLLQDPFRHWNLRHKPGLHTLEHGSTAIDLLFCDEVLGNRLVSSEWMETQVTTLSTLSKQSRKKGSFHSISEVGASPMRLVCILMDSFEYPTFFKKSSSRARPSFSLPWQLQHGAQCAPQMVCTFAPSSKRFPGPGVTGRGWAWQSS